MAPPPGKPHRDAAGSMSYQLVEIRTRLASRDRQGAGNATRSLAVAARQPRLPFNGIRYQSASLVLLTLPGRFPFPRRRLLLAVLARLGGRVVLRAEHVALAPPGHDQ